MLTPVQTNKFKKDIKLAEKQGRPIKKLKAVMAWLVNEEDLDPKFKDHK